MYANYQNNSMIAKTYLVGFASGVFSIFFTSWVLYAIINVNGGLNLLLSMINGFLIAFPIISQLPNSRNLQ
jgi:hypothetical protein